MSDAKIRISKKSYILGLIGCMCVGLTIGAITGGFLMALVIAEALMPHCAFEGW